MAHALVIMMSIEMAMVRMRKQSWRKKKGDLAPQEGLLSCDPESREHFGYNILFCGPKKKKERQKGKKDMGIMHISL